MYLLHHSDYYLCRKGPSVALRIKRSANHITFSKIHEPNHNTIAKEGWREVDLVP